MNADHTPSSVAWRIALFYSAIFIVLGVSLPYFPLWLLVADRLRQIAPRRIIDLGCGSGQFPKLLSDQGITSYLGLDFSRNCIAMARKAAPDLQFVQVDLNKDTTLQDEDYDCVVALEFLEHVDGDLAILEQVRSGTTIIASVPNYLTPAHVRHFESADEVRERYTPLIDDLDVIGFQTTAKGNALFVMQGVRR